MLIGDLLERATVGEGTCPADAREGTPGQDDQAQLGAQLESSTLERNAGENWFCTATSREPRMSWAKADLLLVGVGDPDHLGHALIDELAEGTEGVGIGDPGGGAVVLVEADGLHA
jgi:hypothetical protein